MSIWSPVRTYPDTLESATFSFRIRLPSTRIRWVRHTNPQLFESALQRGNFWIRHESEIVWTLNPDVLLSGDVTRSSLVLYREYSVIKMSTSFPGSLKAEQDANLKRFTTHALLPIFAEESWVVEWIGIRVGYVWTGKSDLNTDTSGRGNFWIPKEKVADSNIFGYVWTGTERHFTNYPRNPGDILKTLHYSYMLHACRFVY